MKWESMICPMCGTIGGAEESARQIYIMKWESVICPMCGTIDGAEESPS